jgi:hypothetical protein
MRQRAQLGSAVVGIVSLLAALGHGQPPLVLSLFRLGLAFVTRRPAALLLIVITLG